MAGDPICGTIEDYEMEESDDRLSKLPNSLIFLILSFLPIRDVILTTLLSKRWNNLWTTIPYLNFSKFAEDYDKGERICNFVNQALMFWKGVKILKFRIDIRSCQIDTSLECDIDPWVRFAVENKVEELKVRVSGQLSEAYKVPQCLKSCSSMRKLSLSGCSIENVGSVVWNQLTSLKIVGVNFYESSIDQILLGTPQLEVFELHILESSENLNIRSTTLKTLRINKYMFLDEKSSLDKVLGIWCPNLETLEISGLFFKCLITDVPYLTDATLGFHDPYDHLQNELLVETLKKVLPTIQYVEKLTLSLWCLEVFSALQKKHLPSPLPNVKILKLYIDSIEPGGMMNLLGLLPELKMLVVVEDHDVYDPIVQNTDEIDDGSSEDGEKTRPFGRNEFESDEVNDFSSIMEFETIDSKSFLLQLKTIEITSELFEDTGIYWFIEFLLKHATMLEKLVVHARGHVAYDHASSSTAAQILLRMPRSSPTAKVFFKTY